MNKFSVRLVLILSLTLSGLGMVFAQDTSVMTLGELVSAADKASRGSEQQAAIPFLNEIMKRAPTFEGAAALQSLQKVRLQLARTYAQLSRWDDSEKYAREYLSSEPCVDRADGLTILCQTAFARNDWQALKKSAQELLSESSKGALSEENGELFLVQALFNLKEYAAALEFLPRVLQRSKDPDMVADLRLMQVRCLFETDQSENLLASLSDMSQGDARYGINLNLFFIRLGDDLFDRSKFLQALAVYRMVVPRSEMLGWHLTQIVQMERTLGQLKGKSGESDKLSQKIDESKKTASQFLNVPEYDAHIAYYEAQIYAGQKRLWEAVSLYDLVYRKYPQTDEGCASLIEMLPLLRDLGQKDQADALARDYLDNNHSGIYPRLVAEYLMRYYREQGQTDKTLDVFGYVDSWDAPENETVRARETVLRYMICFTWLELGDYERAATAFENVIEFSPDSPSAVDSYYWRAMCALMQQNYQNASARFVRFRREYPQSSLAPAALFRTAVCRFGLEDYTGAQDLFDQFIKEFPDDVLMPEALCMRGDILGADGKLDEALADYRQAINLCGKYFMQMSDPSAIGQVVAAATYALAKEASVLDTDAAAYRSGGDEDTAVKKYRQIIAEADHYEQLFGDRADWAQSVFLKGKAQFQLGEADQAVTAYLNTVCRYGEDPAQQGVADILYDLGNIINTRLTADQQKQAVARIQAAREKADMPTLQLRLDVLLAELAGTKTDLGRKLLAQKQPLEAVPPSALGLMCSVAFDQQDFSRAEELFNFFVDHYSDSPFISSAYRLRAEDFFRQKKYNESVALATKALEMFGAVRDLGWAQLLKGQGELALGEYSQAADTFNTVFNVPSWRGPIYAEAMLRMADAWFAQGDFQKAFAFYQRTYLLYKSYDNGNWAAEAYLKSAECLYKLKRDSAARNTYRAMLLDEYVRDLPQADIAKKVLGPKETAELLAGGTNSVETVEQEGSLK